MNMVPWGGPPGRAAVTGIFRFSPVAALILVQIIGITTSVLVAALFGLREKRCIAWAQCGTTP